MHKIKAKLLYNTPLDIGLTALSKPYQKEEVSKELFVKVAKVMKHESIMEHIVFSFDIDGISRLCLQELARHRIASLTVRSTRYTLQHMINDQYWKLDKYFVIPANLSEDIYNDYIMYLTEQILQLKRFYEKGMKNNDILKYLLPESFRTSLVWTINARSLLNFLQLRLASTAHFEIRHLAGLILQSVSFHPLFEDIK